MASAAELIEMLLVEGARQVEGEVALEAEETELQALVEGLAQRFEPLEVNSLCGHVRFFG